MTQQHEVVTRRDQLSISGPVFREFTAKLNNMQFPIENNRAKTHLEFTEMNVIHAVAAYPHPTGEIIMNRTGQNGKPPSDRSPWGRLLISADEQGYPDMLELINHTLHMVATEEKIDATVDDAGQETRAAGSFLVWDILDVDGVDNRKPPEVVEPAAAAGSVSDPKASGASNEAVTEDDLLDLLDGKTIGEFTATALLMTIPVPLRNRMLDANDLIPGWLSAGKVTTDGNTYKKV